MISIIIRTKNEERWITSYSQAVFDQEEKDIEVIVVDNHSTDKTVEKAKRFPVKVLDVDDYLPGKALNVGFKEARGEFPRLPFGALHFRSTRSGCLIC